MASDYKYPCQLLPIEMDSFHGFPLIQALFFCEFHPTQGSRVTFEVPENFTTSGDRYESQDLDEAMQASPTLLGVFSPKDRGYSPGVAMESRQVSNIGRVRKLDFDAISEYLIPKKEICNRLVVVSSGAYKVVGYPVSIESPKYERNALLFNLCFVFQKGADTGAFIPVVRKASRVLKSFEVGLS
jgi:hypothetical protein